MGAANANYPGTQKIFTDKVDHQTEVIAEHVNALQDEVSSIEAFVGISADMPTVPTAPAQNTVAARLHGLLNLVNSKASTAHLHDGIYSPSGHTHNVSDITGQLGPKVVAHSSVVQIGGFSTFSIGFPAGSFSSTPVVTISNGDWNACPNMVELVGVSSTGFIGVAVPMGAEAARWVEATRDWIERGIASKTSATGYVEQSHTHEYRADGTKKTTENGGKLASVHIGYGHDWVASGPPHHEVTGFRWHGRANPLPTLRYPQIGEHIRINWIATTSS